MKNPIAVCLTFVLLFSVSAVSASPATDKLVKSYNAAKSDTAKVQALAGLCKVGNKDAFVAFYQLLSESTFDELKPFRNIFRDPKQINVLIHLGDFLDFLAAPLAKEVKRLRDKGMEDAQIEAQLKPKFRPIIEKIDLRMTLMLEDIAVGAAPNQAKLVAYLKTTFNNKEEGINALEGAIVGLQVLLESGFEALLKSIETDDDQLLVFYFVPRFMEFAVIPTLKMVEDPASSELQRQSAKLFISQFAFTEESVDKMVEAVKHGRYFPLPNSEKEISLEEGFRLFYESWGECLNDQMKKHPEFVDYIGEKYLMVPDGQSEVIDLMHEMDPGKACIWFCKLDPNEVSATTRKVLTLAFYVAAHEKEEMASSEPERYLLMTHLFDTASGTTREEMKLLFNIESLSLEHRKDLLISVFNKLSPKERETAIFLANELGPALRDEVYAAVAGSCSEDEREFIEYFQNKEAEIVS